jgi:hypothetical protein
MKFAQYCNSKRRILVFAQLFTALLLSSCNDEDTSATDRACTESKKLAAVTCAHAVANSLRYTPNQLWAEYEHSAPGICWWDIKFTTNDTLSQFTDRIDNGGFIQISKDTRPVSDIGFELIGRGEVLIDGVTPPPSVPIESVGWALKDAHNRSFSTQIFLTANFPETISIDGKPLKRNYVRITVQYLLRF